MATKTMVIGWDGADFDLILPWVKKGDLPNLKILMDNGRWGKMRAVYPPATANGWSTIVTGKNPGNHSVYEFMQFKEGTYEILPVNSTSRRALDIWQILSEAGKKVVVVGVPLTYPVRPVNGCLVSGFMTPNEKVSYTYPSELKIELKSRVPGYRVNPSEVYKGASEDKYVNALFEVLDKHIDGAVYLAANKDWDFYMVVFNESDWSHHSFWACLDDTHPRFSQDKKRRYGDVIREVYKKLDEALGRLVQLAGENTNILLISDHGVAPLYRQINTNMLLYKMGKLKLKNRFGTRLRYGLARIGLNPSSAQSLAKKLGIASVAADITGGTLSGFASLLFLSMKDIDWNKTEAFAPAGDGQIFVNLSGKYPQGIVQKDRYDSVVQEIISALIKIQDGNLKPIETIFRKEEVFPGQHSEVCPDIQFHCIRGYGGFAHYLFGAKDITTDTTGDVTATHSMNGIIVLKEPAITNKREEIIDAKLSDITPTILHMMEVPVPADLDGRSLSGSAKKISTTNSNYGSAVVEGLTSEEQQDIEERLRSLGYI